MTARPEIRELADALRRHTRRQVDRHGRGGRVEAIVRGLDPLALDVSGLDAQLDESDVTIGDALAAFLATTPLRVGDTLVLVEDSTGDYDAVDVLRG